METTILYTKTSNGVIVVYESNEKDANGILEIINKSFKNLSVSKVTLSKDEYTKCKYDSIKLKELLESKD